MSLTQLLAPLSVAALFGESSDGEAELHGERGDEQAELSPAQDVRDATSQAELSREPDGGRAELHAVRGARRYDQHQAVLLRGDATRSACTIKWRAIKWCASLKTLSNMGAHH